MKTTMNLSDLLDGLKEASIKLIKNETSLVLSLDAIKQLNAISMDFASIDSSNRNFQETPPENIFELFEYLRKVKSLTIISNGSHHANIHSIFLKLFTGVIHLEIIDCDASIFVDLFSLRNQLISLSFFKTNTFDTNELKLISHSFKNGFKTTSWSVLKKFSFQFGNIVQLGDCFKYFESLSYLDLSNNYLIDASSYKLKSLRYLNLSSNCITAFPSYISDVCNSLSVFIISNNQLSTLKGVSSFCNLKMLYANDNFIRNFEDITDLYSLSSLNILKLKGNPIYYRKEYRYKVASVLSPALTRSKTFTLDNRKLNHSEILLVGEFMQNINPVSLSQKPILSLIQSFKDTAGFEINREQEPHINPSNDNYGHANGGDTMLSISTPHSCENSDVDETQLSSANSLVDVNAAFPGEENSSIESNEFYSFHEEKDHQPLHNTSSSEDKSLHAFDSTNCNMSQVISTAESSIDLTRNTTNNKYRKDIISVKRLDGNTEANNVKFIKVSGFELIEQSNEMIVGCTLDLRYLANFVFDEKFVIKMDFDLLTTQKKNRVYFVEETQVKFNVLCRKLSLFHFNYTRKNKTMNLKCLNCSKINFVRSKFSEKPSVCMFCQEASLSPMERKTINSLNSRFTEASEPQTNQLSIINLIDIDSIQPLNPLLLEHLKSSIFESNKETMKAFIKGWLVTTKFSNYLSCLFFATNLSLYICKIETIKMAPNINSVIKCIIKIDVRKIQQILVGCSGQTLSIKLYKSNVCKIITAESERGENFAQQLNDICQLNKNRLGTKSNVKIIREKLIESRYYICLIESLLGIKNEDLYLDYTPEVDTTPFCYRILWYFDLSQGSFRMLTLLTTRSCLFLLKEPHEDSLRETGSNKLENIHLIHHQYFRFIKSVGLYENAPSCLAIDFYIDNDNRDVFQQWLLLFHSSKSMDIFLSSLKVIWEEWFNKILICTTSRMKDYFLTKINPTIWLST